MIKKIIKLKSIGKFTDYNAVGDVEFRKVTLVYAENGRGKTTLCDVLRSLQTGNGDYILGRRTLGDTNQPEACIRLDTVNAEYHAGSWSASYPEIVIFDSAFVHNNIFAGDYVDHEHKKNLYRVIIGEEGVRLARRVEELDRLIRDANRRIGEKRAAVQALEPSRFTAESYLALEQDDDIDQKIRAQEQEVRALQQASDIRTRGVLKSIVLPSLPDTFTELLARQLNDVSAEAEERVRAHISSHLDDKGEAWIEQGLGYAGGNACGFCGQELDSITLVQAYRDYFSDAYRRLKSEIMRLEDAVRQRVGERALVDLQGTLNENETLARFWSQFVEVDIAALPFTELRQALENLREAAYRLLALKKAAPLEIFRPDEQFERALTLFNEKVRTVDEHNGSVERVNGRINTKKAATEAGNLEEVRNALARFQAIKRRFQPEAIQACAEYQAALDTKRDLDTQKDNAKQELDNHSTVIFDRYQNRINELLGMFGAGYRIGDAKGQYVGGTASSSYRIVINDTAVELGDAGTPVSMPSFRNTLSAGDRSTLGLAFFLAQLDQDEVIGGRTIVLDDPFTSQDRFRRTCTQQQIRRQCARAKQVIVLSHDPGFLKLIWDHHPHAEVKTLQMTRAGTNTVINEWDIEAETRAGYFRDHEVLMTYDREGTGTPRDVVRCIRPLLEGYLRIRFPGHFAANDWLGDFIDKIRGADPSSSLHPVRAIVDELADINEYSKKYHHEQNTSADTEAIDDTELQAYVKRTLTLVGGY